MAAALVLVFWRKRYLARLTAAHGAGRARRAARVLTDADRDGLRKRSNSARFNNAPNRFRACRVEIVNTRLSRGGGSFGVRLRRFVIAAGAGTAAAVDPALAAALRGAPGCR